MSRDPLGQAHSIVAAAFDGGARTCLTCSFQAEDVAVLHLARSVRADVPVLFLDTGYHFAEVYEYRDRIAKEWGFEVINLIPKQSVAEQESAFGILYESDPARCCNLRKVEPLTEGLKGYENWLTGLRREQSPTRANLQPEEHHRFPNGLSLRKFSPLYDWTWSEVMSYLAANDIPALPLYEHGYPSIGCEPCTSKPEDGAHARSGRWGGRKLECGLHTVTVKED